MTRDFWKGFVAGAVVVLLVLALVVAGAIWSVKKKMDARVDALEKRTGPIESVEDVNLQVPGTYGQIFYDWHLVDEDGAEISFERFEGKTLLVNFWATWCHPCVAEMPDLEALHEAIEDEEELGLVMISDEPTSVVREFARERGIRVPLYTVELGVPSPISSRARPAAFVVDCQGRVVWRHEGGAEWGAIGEKLLRRVHSRCV